MKIKKILIVDDDVDYVNELEEFLVLKGFVITKRNSTHGILVFIKKNKPELIILDFKINGLTGIDVTKLLKNDKTTKNIPIILVTNYYDDVENIKNVIKYGINVCLKKIIQPELLYSEIKKIEAGQ